MISMRRQLKRILLFPTKERLETQGIRPCSYFLKEIQILQKTRYPAQFAVNGPCLRYSNSPQRSLFVLILAPDLSRAFQTIMKGEPDAGSGIWFI
jgi:hypothetical protein